jgi:DNA helicase-2/ATP-dependent DNA helicase PcrA
MRAGKSKSTAATAAGVPESGSGLKRGMRVFHQKFGYGKIIVVDGDKLEIAFEKAGQKKVMASFVAPA